jgi:hypothetical protein
MSTTFTITLDADLEPRVVEAITIAIGHGLQHGRNMFPIAKGSLPAASYNLTACTWSTAHVLSEAVAALACIEGFTKAGEKLPDLKAQVH